jgi:uncharacterized protein (DUF486 family)
MRTVLLLFASNAFMTIAWYGHLKYRDYSLVVVIIASWLIALPEYALQVPANRIGYSQFSATQLKIIQEAISITVFIVFGYLYLKESPNWRTGLAFLLILAAVALAVSSRAEQRQQEGDQQVAMREEKLAPPEVK